MSVYISELKVLSHSHFESYPGINHHLYNSYVKQEATWYLSPEVGEVLLHVALHMDSYL